MLTSYLLYLCYSHSYSGNISSEKFKSFVSEQYCWPSQWLICLCWWDAVSIWFIPCSVVLTHRSPGWRLNMSFYPVISLYSVPNLDKLTIFSAALLTPLLWYAWLPAMTRVGHYLCLHSCLWARYFVTLAATLQHRFVIVQIVVWHTIYNTTKVMWTYENGSIFGCEALEEGPLIVSNFAVLIRKRSKKTGIVREKIIKSPSNQDIVFLHGMLSIHTSVHFCMLCR